MRLDRIFLNTIEKEFCQVNISSMSEDDVFLSKNTSFNSKDFSPSEKIEQSQEIQREQALRSKKKMVNVQ
jgi:hypothetical protein